MAATAKSAAQEPLDKLQTQVGSVLFQLGNICKHAHQGDKKALERAKAKARTGIPDAHKVFEDAIEELERELTKARAVIDGDLHQLQEKRAAREKAAGAARLQAANGTSANGPNVKKEPGTGDATRGAEGIGRLDGSGAEDPLAAAAAGTNIPDDLNALLGDGFPGVTSNDASANAAGGQNTGGDADLEDLFGDGMDFEGDFAMNTDATGDGISNVFPGLEKYVDQAQSNGAAAAAGTSANGQNATGAEPDFDLDALLSGIADSGSADVPTSSTVGGSEGKDDQGKEGNAKSADKDAKQNGASKDQGKADEAVQNTDVNVDAMDLMLDFPDNGDGGLMEPDTDYNSWFDFDN